ncbi:MAG TPA: hypothetical protein VNZ45_16820, partial [Bacteroidia bacterium]|nr:hypothetical protein [Bacteroidia bacterium]
NPFGLATLGSLAAGGLASATAGSVGTALLGTLAYSAIGSVAGSALGGGSTNMPALPTPAAPAPIPRANGGAAVQVGTDTSMNRVASTSPNQGNGTDNSGLSSLGRSGLAL